MINFSKKSKKIVAIVVPPKIFSKVKLKVKGKWKFKVNVNVVEADTGLTGNSYPEWKLNKDSNYNNLDYPASVFKYWQRDISQAEIGCFN